MCQAKEFFMYWNPEGDFEASYQEAQDRFDDPKTNKAYALWKGSVPEHLYQLIEGMFVSVDVSTGDEDAGHRLFGKVDLVQDCPGKKNNVGLLVQEVEANF